MADKLKESIEYVAEKLEDGIKKVVLTGAVMLSSLTGGAKENTVLSPTNEEVNKTEQSIQNEAAVDINNDKKNISFEIAQEQKDLMAAREKPCTSKQEYISIGIFDNNTLYNATTNDMDKKARPDFIDGLERPEYSINSEEEYKKVMVERDGALASCHGGDAYILPKYNASEEFKLFLDSIAQSEGKNVYHEYVKDNPVANIAVKTHEVDVHGLHYAKNVMDNGMDSPYTAAYKSDVTEKLADYSEWLVIAQIYTNLKEQGAENIQINGENVPLGDILDYKPGLREIVEKDGFDINDKKCLTKIAKASSEYWDSTRSSPYEVQAREWATSAKSNSLIGMIKTAREFEKQKDEMYKDINIIGHNVDVPKEARQFFEPTKERLDSVLVGFNYASNEDLLKIDKYMDSLGLKNDDEKTLFIIQQTKNITERAPNADLKFRDLLLACGNKDEKDSEIIYADRIKDTYHKDGTVTVSKVGKNASYTTKKSDLDNLALVSKNEKAKQELNENLAKIHPKVETVKENPKQNINMIQIMNARER